VSKGRILSTKKGWLEMDGVITEYPAEIVTEGEVEETDSVMTAGEEADVLDVPISTIWDWINTEALSYIRITWA